MIGHQHERESLRETVVIAFAQATDRRSGGIKICEAWFTTRSDSR
jgi:hypothetical protein